MSGDGRPGRSAAPAEAVRAVEAELDAAWDALLRAESVAPGSPDEQALCTLVVDNPDRYGWRVVDAALDRLTCVHCGSRLGSGPSTCDTCGYHNGTRVASVVARTRHRYSPRVRAGYELVRSR